MRAITRVAKVIRADGTHLRRRTIAVLFDQQRTIGLTTPERRAVRASGGPLRPESPRDHGPSATTLTAALTTDRPLAAVLDRSTNTQLVRITRSRPHEAMSGLEDLKPGLRLDGIVPGELVTVIARNRTGRMSANRRIGRLTGGLASECSGETRWPAPGWPMPKATVRRIRRGVPARRRVLANQIGRPWSDACGDDVRHRAAAASTAGGVRRVAAPAPAEVPAADDEAPGRR